MWNHFSCDVETLHRCMSGVVPRLDIKPVSSALAEWSLNHWTIREVPWNSAILDHRRRACKLMSPGFNKCSDILCFWPVGPSQCVPVFSPEMLHFLMCERKIWLAGRLPPLRERHGCQDAGISFSCPCSLTLVLKNKAQDITRRDVYASGDVQSEVSKKV